MVEEYLDAKRLGDRAYRHAVNNGQYPYLQALDEIVKPEDIVAENPMGLQEIQLSDIVGTKTAGRQQAFAWNFMPILDQKSEFAGKWSALYVSAVKEGIREPIKVYEYMHRFYVLEGNKRVSVSKFNRSVSIFANVIRLLPKRTEEKENRIYYEFVDFYKDSRLFDITFSEPGYYQKLYALLGMEQGQAWPDELRSDVRGGFERFSDIFRSMGGASLSITTGDAFLVYLQVYGLNKLLDVSNSEIRGNLERIWNEFLKSAGEVRFVTAPDEMKKDTNLLDFFTPGNGHRGVLRIAFIYEKNTENSGWVYGHELGRSYIEEHFGGHILTRKFENCQDQEQIGAAISEAAEWQADIIFTTSESMVEASLAAAVRYPDIHILNCSVNTSYNSIRTYYGRMYEAKFLMGVLAASLSESPDLGYVEHCPLYGTIANVNAFAIGAQAVNPRARVHLLWSGQQDCDWQKRFEEKDISMISGPELIRPTRPTREFGLFRRERSGIIRNLAMPVFDWGKYYEFIIQSVLEGAYNDTKLAKTHQALNYWFGMSSGVIDIILSGNLPYTARRTVDFLRKEIIKGPLSPFRGELHSQDGIVRLAGDPPLTDEDIVEMQWLNDNVLGEIPPLSAFSEAARELIRMGGFLK